MIVKEMSHSLRSTGATPNFGGMLQYIMRKDAGLIEPKSGKVLVVTHNLIGRDRETWEHELREQFERSGVRAKGRTGLFHQILSWKSSDTPHLTLEIIEDCVRHYLDLRNPEASALSVGHFGDGDGHYHVHVISNGVKFDGKSNRLSRAAFRSIVREMNEYQKSKYPQLTSVIDIGTGKSKSNGKYWMERTGRTSKEELVKALLDDALKSAVTKSELIEFLKKEGVDYYERGSRSAGVIWEGTKFRLSTLGYSDGVRELENREARFNELSAMHNEVQVLNQNIDDDKDLDKSTGLIPDL